MKKEIKTLYAFHLINGFALVIVGNSIFLDRLLLHIGFDMAQLGIVRAFSSLLPMTVSLFLSPIILRRRWNSKVVGYGYMIRILFPFAFLLLAQLTTNRNYLTVGITVLTVLGMTFALTANNCLLALQKEHIPPDRIGLVTGIINILWYNPAFLLAIAAGWFIDRRQVVFGSSLFFSYLILYSIAFSIQILASFFILRIKPSQGERKGEKEILIRSILQPFLDPTYFRLLLVSFLIGIFITVTSSFLNPYLIQVRGFSLTALTTLDAIVSIGSYFILPLWGKLADRIGGKTILSVSLFGMAAGFLFLSVPGERLALFVLFALFAWSGRRGLFGMGVQMGKTYLTLSLSKKESSNVYIASVLFAEGIGGFMGSLSGGFFLENLKERYLPEFPVVPYRIFFTVCGVGIFLLGIVVSFLKIGRRPVSTRRKEDTD